MNMPLTARQLDRLGELALDHKVVTARDALRSPKNRWPAVACAAQRQFATGAVCREGAILPARRRVATMTTGSRWAMAPRGSAHLSSAGPGVAEVDAQPVASSTPLAGGHLLTAISTSIVGILREHYGRGPMKAKTYVLDDIIVVVMRGSGFTPLEQTIMDSGQPDRVIEMREDFQRVMAKRYKQTIEELTSREVLAFLSQAHVEPDITMEIFFVDGPLEGFGAVEITEPQ